MNDLQTNNNFLVFGISIEKFSVYYGLFLILWGIIISFLSGSGSFTSYIPSFLGFPIFIFSILSIKFEQKRKMFMHIVVFFGVIILLGGLDFVRTLVNGNSFQNMWADISKLMMLVTGPFFIFQCIKSFIHARRNKDTLS
tara:strand:- start:674 stop:1093 length:420 start_codon:yes stop_codon:yes gene_type:complete